MPPFFPTPTPKPDKKGPSSRRGSSPIPVHTNKGASKLQIPTSKNAPKGPSTTAADFLSFQSYDEAPRDFEEVRHKAKMAQRNKQDRRGGMDGMDRPLDQDVPQKRSSRSSAPKIDKDGYDSDSEHTLKHHQSTMSQQSPPLYEDILLLQLHGATVKFSSERPPHMMPGFAGLMGRGPARTLDTANINTHNPSEYDIQRLSEALIGLLNCGADVEFHPLTREQPSLDLMCDHCSITFPSLAEKKDHCTNRRPRCSACQDSFACPTLYNDHLKQFHASGSRNRRPSSLEEFDVRGDGLGRGSYNTFNN